jgi:hypothetical protein
MWTAKLWERITGSNLFHTCPPPWFTLNSSLWFPFLVSLTVSSARLIPVPWSWKKYILPKSLYLCNKLDIPDHGNSHEETSCSVKVNLETHRIWTQIIWKFSDERIHWINRCKPLIAALSFLPDIQFPLVFSFCSLEMKRGDSWTCGP